MPASNTALQPKDLNELLNYRHLFEGLIEQSVAGIYLLQDDKLIYVNEAFARMCGTSRENLSGQLLSAVAPRDQREALLQQYARRLRGENPENTFIVRIQRPGEEGVRAIEIHGRLITYRARPAVIGVGIDVTSQLQRHRELEESKARLSELLSYIQRVRDEERLDISMELHDAVGGMLSALRFDLTRIAKKAEKIAPDRLDEEDQRQIAELQHTAHQASQLVQETIRVIRHISEGLHPSALPHLGLVEAMRSELHRFHSRYGVQVTFDHPDSPITLQDDLVCDLYRVFQEALNNVAKHAAASSIQVMLSHQSDTLRLELLDDGTGLDSAEPPRGGYGLYTMGERVRRYGGSLSIGAGSAGGVHLRVTVPTPR